jgi:hypothetical protein
MKSRLVTPFFSLSFAISLVPPFYLANVLTKTRHALFKGIDLKRQRLPIDTLRFPFQQT